MYLPECVLAPLQAPFELPIVHRHLILNPASLAYEFVLEVLDPLYPICPFPRRLSLVIPCYRLFILLPVSPKYLELGFPGVSISVKMDLVLEVSRFKDLFLEVNDVQGNLELLCEVVSLPQDSLSLLIDIGLRLSRWQLEAKLEGRR